MQGDTANARGAYQDFLALWKDADPDIPILIAAKVGTGGIEVTGAPDRKANCRLPEGRLVPQSRVAFTGGLAGSNPRLRADYEQL